MLWELINVFMILWIYFYLIKLYQTGCKCALTPNYYFLAFYVTISLVMFTLDIFTNGNHIAINLYMGFTFVYFVLTIIFIFVTFGYVNELEQEKCKCTGEIGPDILEIFAWLRILSFVLAIASVITVLNGHNKVVTLSKKTPRRGGSATRT